MKQASRGGEKARITPMFAQYLEAKRANPDCLLFFRMGDFYELFFEDAEIAAPILNIALTKRGRHLGKDVPMCGVPVRAYEDYLNRLTKAGLRVAICEQMEDPEEAKRRPGKPLVKRAVVEIVTAATVTDDMLLEPRSHNYLAALGEVRGETALAWADLSTGDFHVTSLARPLRDATLARIRPKELLLNEEAAPDPTLDSLLTELGTASRRMGRESFSSHSAERRLKALLGVAELGGFADFSAATLSVMGAIADYVALTKRASMPTMRPPTFEHTGDTMLIDAATRRNLEIVRALSGTRKGSLLHAVDRAVTAAGGRLLEMRLTAPSLDPGEIDARLDAVDYFIARPQNREAVRRTLRTLPDIERALSRLALGKGGPRDLGAIRDALEAARDLRAILACEGNGNDLGGLPAELSHCLREDATLEQLADTLRRALVAEPPPTLRDGGCIAEKYDPALDEIRYLRDHGRSKIAALEGEYRAQSGLKGLRIRHNNLLGYFIEAPGKAADRLMAPPLNETFIFRAQTKNTARFASIVLTELENQITHASENALETEKTHCLALSQACLSSREALGALARAMARCDVAQCFAEVSSALGWCRPKVEESGVFMVEGGRHPIVEAALKAEGKDFIANDLRLDASAGEEEQPGEREVQDKRIWLVTGPNMAGKSTFLRQNALIALLAQSGAHVPARHARTGLVDRLFSRVGASDDLARGRSTFMVEMVETAAILNQAGPRALVVLDEIGRGTATWDGLAIAWSCLEHIHDKNRCRTLFATHFHELGALSERMDSIGVASAQVKEWKGEPVFLHTIARGAADRSWGVQVAKLAGLPPNAVARAGAILEALEREGWKAGFLRRKGQEETEVAERRDPDGGDARLAVRMKGSRQKAQDAGSAAESEGNVADGDGAQEETERAGAQPRRGAADPLGDLPLFAPFPARPAPPEPVGAEGALSEALAGIHPDDLSPREALDALYALKRLAEGRMHKDASINVVF